MIAPPPVLPDARSERSAPRGGARSADEESRDEYLAPLPDTASAETHGQRPLRTIRTALSVFQHR